MASLAECPVVRPCAVDAAPEGYRWLDMGESIPDEVHWYSDTGLITTNQAEAMRMGDRGAQARFFHVSAGGSGSFPDGGGCVVKLPTASDYAILLAKYNKLLLQLRTALKPIG